MSTQLSKEVLRFRAAERRMLRWLRRLVDWADDRLHAAEVRFREESQNAPAKVTRDRVPTGQAARVTTSDADVEGNLSDVTRPAPLSWERIAKANRKAALPGKKKRRMTAAEFDQKYAGFAGVGLAR